MDYVSKLGLDIDTSNLSRADQMMQVVAGSASKVEDAINRLATSFDSSGKAASSAGTGVDVYDKALRSLGGGLQSVADAQNRFMLQLQDQANILGKSQADILRYKAAQLGIGDAAEANIAKIEAFNNAANRGQGLKTLGKDAKLTANELLNVGYQFQDLGVQLASGQNPITAIIQQGSQLSGVFATAGARGISFGGVVASIAGSLGSLLVAALPVIAAIGAIGGAWALADREMQKGINTNLTEGLNLTEKQLDRLKEKGVSTTVTLGDSFKGFWDTVGQYAAAGGEKILNAMGTSWSEVKKTVSGVLDWLAQAIGNNIATTVGFFNGWFKAVVAIFKNLPAVLGDIFITTFNAIGKYANSLFNQVTGSINSVIKAVSSLSGLKLPEIPTVDFKPLDNQYKGAGQSVADAFNQGMKDGFNGTKALGAQFLKDWGENTLKEGRKRVSEAAGKAGKEAAGSFADNFRRGLVVDKALTDFNSAFTKGMYDAMQKGKAIVDRALTDINKRLAQTGGQKLVLANIGSVSNGDDLKALLDYQQAYVEVVTQTGEVNQKLIDETYQRIYGERQVTEEYNRQIDRLSHLKELTVQSRTDSVYKGLTDAFDNFFDELPRKGLSAFKDLASSITDVFAQAFSDALKAAFDPFITKFKDALSKSVTNALGSFSSDGKSGSGLLGSLQKGIDGIFGSGTTTKLASSLTNIVGGYSAGAGIVSATGLNGKTAAQQLNSSIGSAIGAAIGSFIPGIGTVIGSVIGGILGGLLGPKSADNRAAANLTASGSISGSIYGKPTDETSSALSSAISAISSGYDALKSLGGTMSAYITSLHIGNRDKSEATLSNGTTINAGTVGDAADLANDALMAVLKNTTFASDALNKVKNALISSGQSFDDTTSALSSVKNVLDAVATPLSDWQKNLKSIKDVFDPLIAETGKYSAALQEAYNTAKQALATSFDADIADQLLKAQSSVAGQYSDMLKTQQERIEDATALGGDLTKVLALNSQEMSNFIDSLNGSYDSITDLDKAFNALIATAQAAGKDTFSLEQAYQANKSTLATNFNTDISGQIDQLSNPTLASLKTLLKQQQDRLANATALGANIVAVERLNALETKNFFDQLTDDQKLSLGDYLGLIEDYSGKIGVVLARLNDALQAKVDDFANTKSSLEDTISSWTSITKSLKDARDNIVDQYSNVTPLAKITDLRSQFGELVAQAYGGNQDAANALPDLASKLIDLSRSLYGSTSTFASDYDLVTKGLQVAETAAQGQVDVAQSQLDTLEKQYDILVEIKDVLSQSDPNLEYLANTILQLDANNSEIADYLAEYLNLTAQQAASNFTASQLSTAAEASVVSGGTTQSTSTTSDNVEAMLQEVANSIAELNEQAAASGNAQLDSADTQTKLLKDIKDLLTVLAKAA